MSEWVVLGIIAAGVGGFIFLLWRYGEAKKDQGRAEVRSDLSEKAASNAKKTGEIMAEHRSDDDTAGRLSRGDF